MTPLYRTWLSGPGADLRIHAGLWIEVPTYLNARRLLERG